MAKRSSQGSRKTGIGGAAGDSDSKAPQASDDVVQSIARLHVWQIQAVRDLLVVAAVLALIWLGYALRAVTVPLLVALMLAYLFEPLIKWMIAKWKMSRAAAAGSIVAAFVVVVVLFVAIVAPFAVGQTLEIARDVRSGDFGARVGKAITYLPSNAQEPVRESLNWLPGIRPTSDAGESPVAGDELDAIPEDGADADSVPVKPPGDADVRGIEETQLNEDQVRTIVRDELQAASDAQMQKRDTDWLGIARRSVNTVLGVLGTLIAVSLLTFLIPFYFFFFSLWYHDVMAFGAGLLPEKNKSRTIELLAKMDAVVSGFVRGRIVIALIMGVLFAVGWQLCGVPYAIVIGLLIGLLSIVPYLGGLGIPLAAGLLLFKQIGEPHDSDLWWLWAILGPTVVYAVVQVIETYFLTPMIAGKATNLDPVTIVVAVLAGGSVLGVYGMLLAIPLAACGKILFSEVLLPQIRAWARGERADPLPIRRE